jgi:hypothetical protein
MLNEALMYVHSWITSRRTLILERPLFVHLVSHTEMCFDLVSLTVSTHCHEATRDTMRVRSRRGAGELIEGSK